MQAAHKFESTLETSVKSNIHSARLEKILLDKSYRKSSPVVEVEYSDISIESRLEAEHELEQALIRMFGYQ